MVWAYWIGSSYSIFACVNRAHGVKCEWTIKTELVFYCERTACADNSSVHVMVYVIIMLSLPLAKCHKICEIEVEYTIQTSVPVSSAQFPNMRSYYMHSIALEGIHVRTSPCWRTVCVCVCLCRPCACDCTAKLHARERAQARAPA